MLLDRSRADGTRLSYAAAEASTLKCVPSQSNSFISPSSHSPALQMSELPVIRACVLVCTLGANIGHSKKVEIAAMHEQRHEHQRNTEDVERGYDPVQAAWRQTRTFNQAWFNNGESLTVLQRSGFTLLSLLSMAFALYFLRICAMEFRDGDWIFLLIFGGAMFLFLTVAVKGLQNVLRSPPTP